MADMFEVECPCCHGVLQIDPDTQAVITHRELPKKPVIEDLAAAVTQLKGDAGQRFSRRVSKIT